MPNHDGRNMTGGDGAKNPWVPAATHRIATLLSLAPSFSPACAATSKSEEKSNSKGRRSKSRDRRSNREERRSSQRAQIIAKSESRRAQMNAKPQGDGRRPTPRRGEERERSRRQSRVQGALAECARASPCRAWRSTADDGSGRERLRKRECARAKGLERKARQGWQGGIASV